MSRTKAQLEEALRGARADNERLRENWLDEMDRVAYLGGQVQELNAQVLNLEEDLYMWREVDAPAFRLEIDAWRNLAAQYIVAAEGRRQRANGDRYDR